MDEPPEGRQQRVTPLELFFDLVFVYAITQVTRLMARDPTWQGVGRGLAVLAAIWWAWTGYAWLTNALEPEEGRVRAGMFGAMAAMLVVALAIPDAFGEDATLFAVAYFVVGLLNLVLFTIAGRRDPSLLRPAARVLPTATIGPLAILGAASVEGPWRATLWVVALVVMYANALIGHGKGWHVSPAHFAERYGLIVIIALGESVIAIGFGAEGVELTGAVATVALGIAVLAALWWAYFDVFALLAQRQLSRTSGAVRTRLARDLYSYLHLPMIAGIVLLALALEKTIEHVNEPLARVPAIALCGGLSLYYLAHVAERIRLVHSVRRTTEERPGWIGPGRLATSVVLLTLIPIAVEVPALASLALVTAVCWALIAWDIIHYRQDRIEVRRARP